jgi:hypothetical protein
VQTLCDAHDIRDREVAIGIQSGGIEEVIEVAGENDLVALRDIVAEDLSHYADLWREVM